MNNIVFNAVLGLTVLLGSNSFAAVVERDWEGHKTDSLCYAISFPKDQGNNKYITISQRPSEGILNEVAFISGYAEEDNVEGTVSIDGKQPFRLLTYKGNGFVKSGDVETMLVNQMKAGKVMEVKWTNPAGEYTVDKYSLYGFSAAHRYSSDCK